ncbi:MAG TPA: hypothetical protein VK846_03530, partial [Candidatus Limnocylindria bacterium]|nr:hypothetical protein [Candidatus Limnocylindria bacterium]
KTNSVTCILGGEEHGNGLECADQEKDGRSTIVMVDNQSCRFMNPDNGANPTGYLYFKIDPSFRSIQGTVKIEVEYFDVLFEKPISFGLQYDSTGSAYAWGRPTVRLRGSNTWQTARFRIADGAFQSRQNGRADFRIWCKPPELYVRRVTVTRDDETK